VKVVVYGSRPDGHAKVIIDLAADGSEFEIIGLIDDHEENSTRQVRGLTVLGTGNDLAGLRERLGVEGLVLGFGESRSRGEIGRHALASGLMLPSLIHPSAHVSASARLGEGVQVLARAYVGPDADLGLGALVNTAAIVEHDGNVGEGAVVGPAATLCGRVAVGSEATVGAGATILPDVQIGSRAVVGAGALVREDVAAEMLVAGVPARPLIERTSR
jgi:sugar O-acyltransferase (sialic acid O-acetyltransferase NeuD family)